MTTAWRSFDARILGALDAVPSRVPVVLGGDVSGRSTLLRRLARTLGPDACQYVDLERVTSTPERFVTALSAASPFRGPAESPAPGPQAAYAHMLGLFDQARTRAGGAATFLLDEWLELRTFEHFPGLRRAVTDTVERLAASPNRFVLTTRFAARALRLLEHAPDRFVVYSLPDLAVPDIAADLLRIPGCRSDTAEEFAHTILALSGGRIGYVRAIVDALLTTPSPGDPISSLVACLAPGGSLDRVCRYSYEYRLHRARGYGALKAVLGVLAVEEPLTLTDIAVRLGRTPGSTRDYLGWLEDVDLVVAHRKRYTFSDPLLRAWVSLFDRAAPPQDDEVASALQRYALARLSAPRTPAAP